MQESDWERVRVDLAGLQGLPHEIDEQGERRKLLARCKRGDTQLACSFCGKLVKKIAASYEREVVCDLPSTIMLFDSEPQGEYSAGEAVEPGRSE